MDATRCSVDREIGSSGPRHLFASCAMLDDGILQSDVVDGGNSASSTRPSRSSMVSDLTSHAGGR